MNPLIAPILAAVVVTLLVWGIWQLVESAGGGKKKLQRRLVGDGAARDEAEPLRLEVVRRQVAAGGFTSLLVRMPILRRLADRLARAWPELPLAGFLGLCAGCMLIAMLLGLVFTESLTITGIAALLGAAIPIFLLNNRVNRRQKTLLEQLPDGLDFLARVLQAGHSFSTGLQMMGEEMPHPLADEFRRCYEEQNLGQPMEQSLREAALRIDNPDFGFFVTAVLIQRQTGGDLSEVLGNISHMIRQRMRLQAHVRAKTAEGRFTGYVLVAFPIIMFALCDYLSPEYAHVLLDTTTGHYLIAGAAGMLMLGLFAIRKITTIRV